MALYPVFAVGDPVRYQVAGASGPYGPVRQLDVAERICLATCSSSSMLHPDRSVLAGETLDREGRVRVYSRLQ